MGLYITHDYWIGYENNQLLILEKLRDDIFIKRYPIFKTALELLKTLDFTVRIYSIEIMRDMALMRVYDDWDSFEVTYRKSYNVPNDETI